MPFHNSLIAAVIATATSGRRIVIDAFATVGAAIEFYTGNVLEADPARIVIDPSVAYPPLVIESPDLGNGKARIQLSGKPGGLGSLVQVIAKSIQMGNGVTDPALYIDGGTGLCAWSPAFPGAPGQKLATAVADAGGTGNKPLQLKAGLASGTSSAGGILTVTFSFPFETAGVAALITPGSLAAAPATSPNQRAVNLSTSGFQIGGVAPSKAMTYNWVAIGY